MNTAYQTLLQYSSAQISSMMLMMFVFSMIILVAPITCAPTFPDNEFHNNNWGKVVSRTAGFIAGGINTPFPGGQVHDPFTFVVIGANTGINSNDPLWKAIHSKRKTAYSIFVEPIPFLFKKLQANMKEFDMGKATCVNAAISGDNKNLTIYCSGMKEDGSIAVEANFNKWAQQMCSMNKEHVYGSHDSREVVDKYMREYNVLGMSVENLLGKYANNAPVKMVQIDVEGFDDQVRRSRTVLVLAYVVHIIVFCQYVYQCIRSFLLYHWTIFHPCS